MFNFLFYSMFPFLLYSANGYWKVMHHLPHPFVFFYKCDKCNLYGETAEQQESFDIANAHNKEHHKKTQDCAAGWKNYKSFGK